MVRTFNSTRASRTVWTAKLATAALLGAGALSAATLAPGAAALPMTSLSPADIYNMAIPDAGEWYKSEMSAELASSSSSAAAMATATSGGNVAAVTLGPLNLPNLRNVLADVVAALGNSDNAGLAQRLVSAASADHVDYASATQNSTPSPARPALERRDGAPPAPTPTAAAGAPPGQQNPDSPLASIAASMSVGSPPAAPPASSAPAASSIASSMSMVSGSAAPSASSAPLATSVPPAASTPSAAPSQAGSQQGTPDAAPQQVYSFTLTLGDGQQSAGVSTVPAAAASASPTASSPAGAEVAKASSPTVAPSATSISPNVKGEGKNIVSPMALAVTQSVSGQWQVITIYVAQPEATSTGPASASASASAVAKPATTAAATTTMAKPTTAATATATASSKASVSSSSSSPPAAKPTSSASVDPWASQQPPLLSASTTSTSNGAKATSTSSSASSTPSPTACTQQQQQQLYADEEAAAGDGASTSTVSSTSATTASSTINRLLTSISDALGIQRRSSAAGAAGAAAGHEWVYVDEDGVEHSEAEIRADPSKWHVVDEPRHDARGLDDALGGDGYEDEDDAEATRLADEAMGEGPAAAAKAHDGALDRRSRGGGAVMWAREA